MKKKVVSLTSAVLLTSTFATNALASTYTVQKGDTLSNIASKYKTTVPALKTINKLSTDMIYVDQVLKVQGSTTNVAPVKPVKTTTTNQVKQHTVVKGDSLSKIASTYKISLSDLRKWNNQTSDLIYPGQKFIVSSPVGSTSSAAATPSTSSATPKPATEAQQTTKKEYLVKSGDYLGKIAANNGLTVQKIKELNGLQSDMIFVGQKLVLSKTIPEETTASPTPDSNISNLVEEAKSLIGVPYAWGGNSPSGFDCSGFIHYVLNQAGTQIGRYSAEGYYSRSYYVDKPQVGDFVFFENTYKKGISHMGIYLGNNEFIHADATKGVTITNLNNSYYKSHFDGYKRLY
ncbi:NLP/P60 [Mycobacteroides abscessus subsp. abscessus]|nr:NLP/P60 [Mycobacteroides abscessus subsp. abscessus]